MFIKLKFQVLYRGIGEGGMGGGGCVNNIKKANISQAEAKALLSGESFFNLYVNLFDDRNLDRI